MDPEKGGFSVDQLMELAGLSVAMALAKVYSKDSFQRVLVCAGNNGGDGLVAARHLFHFGYRPVVHYPKATEKLLYKNLRRQLENLNVPFVENLDEELKTATIVLDAIFGFSFRGDIRPPFDEVIKKIKGSKLPIVSIDIPSGWDVEKGNVNGRGPEPEMLVSLTIPKESAKFFKGKYHYLGGRFVPPEFAKRHGLVLPEYPGIEQCVDITNWNGSNL
ncbi:NADHX epimerase [Spizellomyces punctatus DAOM BR117]|uniref:NAD(P)H-hydrate epimerase n=1 Tax=Spizellomyces punctatus (strain DAOM BR117) TaxID=645134 RepID=A0A0L0HPB5_SPIPD|nr:NADHX epimerase [Spizellomyces punctatus DAOM BR117]KND03246.1 hypothetical protein SPPG_02299 [Spizellomyces punctatus DAOM BR117]|eukprot:XP_016611285.1 hypothetical protein SPPG_02299 [Spizellomyces punctatus DAOM BR117]